MVTIVITVTIYVIVCESLSYIVIIIAAGVRNIDLLTKTKAQYVIKVVRGRTTLNSTLCK